MLSTRRSVRAAASVAVSVLLLAGVGGCRANQPVSPATASPAAGRSPQAPPTFGTGADAWPSASVTITSADGREHAVAVRVADRPERRQQGLMGVEAVPPGTGMLFLFPTPHDGGFWMKDTLVPLDIAYVAEGEIVAVLQMEPCVEYEVASEDCPAYTPGAAYDTTLEVAQGWFAAAGIDVGARLVSTAGPAAS